MKRLPFKVYLDMDGVLADFDKRAIEIIGVRPRDYEGQEGEEALWDKVYSVPNFFLTLSPMPDAFDLWNGVVGLTGQKPGIITGTPKERRVHDSMLPAQQKLMWGRRWFDADEIITCPSRDKCKHMSGAGDVLIDDWHKYQYKWEGAGGAFILHKSAAESLRALAGYIEQQVLM